MRVDPATRRLRVRAGPPFRLIPDSVIDGVSDPLLATKISFGSLHRYVAKEKLDLV